jgi:hypothetical protein
MKKIFLLLFLPFASFGQDCNLIILKDNFTKEEIKSGGIQAIYTLGLLNAQYINIALAKKGENFIIAYQRKLLNDNKDDKQFDISDDSKLLIRFADETVIEAKYNGKTQIANITWDRTFGTWAFNYEVEFTLQKTEFDKIPNSEALAIRVDNGIFPQDFEIKEKFKQTKPRLYFSNIANCLRLK